MYEGFARVYDRLMADFDYDAWADYLMDMASRYGVKVGTACECACGTGSIAIRLARRGVKVTGVDASEHMLARAQQNAREAGVSIPFALQDMRSLQLPRAVDALLCPCDGVNYLMDDRDLAAFFCAASGALKPGGLLIFDISSEAKLREQAERGVFFEDLPDLTYLWTNRWNAKRRAVEMELCFFALRPDGLYERFDERQVQRAHALDPLVRTLKAAGFTGIQCFGDLCFDPPGPDECRIHIAAQKPNHQNKGAHHA